MNSSATRRGSSFGKGPRRGTDPEGGERSGWKGLCGPSGLNLDHARIPDIQTKVYNTLLPLVVAVEEPIPLSQFTQKCCDVLLPVLEKQQDLGPHEFKSQWGRLNEFVCPALARMAGLGDSGYNREAKTVCIDLKVESSSEPTPSPQRAPTADRPASYAHASAAAAPAVGIPASPTLAAVPAAAVGPGPAATMLPTPTPHSNMPMPMPIPGAPGSGMPPLPPLPMVPPCAYCHGPHAMKHCADFHSMLQSIYQAGYQQGMAAVATQAAAAAAGDGPAARLK